MSYPTKFATNTKIRNSNMELLRICAMLMIVMYHIVCHCILKQLTGADINAVVDTTLFSKPEFYKKIIIIVFSMTFGIIGNALFVLISGYFLVEKEKINLAKTSQKLLLQLGFAALFLLVASTIYYRVTKNNNTNLIDIYSFNNMSWFVGYYFLIVLIASLFLNKILARKTKKEYATFLLICLAIISFSWSGQILDNISGGLRTLCNGIFLYALGGYIKKYNPFKQVKTFSILLICCVVYFLVYLSSYNITANNIAQLVVNGNASYFYQGVMWFENYSIVIIILGVCIFELFKRIKIENSKILNFFGSATFMVYLIHDNLFVHKIYLSQDWVGELYYRPIIFILKLFLWASITFVVGLICYTIYLLLFKIYSKSKWIFVKSESQENMDIKDEFVS